MALSMPVSTAVFRFEVGSSTVLTDSPQRRLNDLSPEQLLHTECCALASVRKNRCKLQVNTDNGSTFHNGNNSHLGRAHNI